MKFIDKYFRAGKTIPLFYYLRGVVSSLVPRKLLIARRKRILKNWESRPDAGYIRERVDYYAGLPYDGRIVSEGLDEYGGPVHLPLKAISHKTVKSRYLFDVNSVARWFDADLKMNLLPGDNRRNPKVPMVIKARRIAEDGENVTILRMDTAFLYLHPRDRIPFLEKKNKLFFRGAIHGKPKRIAFFEQWASHPLLDLGDTDRHHITPWHADFITIPEHFNYRYILCLEGNDLSSSLQWVMASNCVPVMPRPTVETWMMESRMIPGVHYIEIAPDFSDVAKKMEYYDTHPEEAERISQESKKWAQQFFNRRRERLIALLVLERYLHPKTHK